MSRIEAAGRTWQFDEQPALSAVKDRAWILNWNNRNYTEEYHEDPDRV